MSAPRPGVPSPLELESLCVELAAGAARLVAAAVGEHVVDTKSTATDLVTDVDRRSEQWLLAELVRRRPDDAVLAEEGASRGGSSGVRWVLDPIDGTVNFVLGLPHYAVSVAAEVDGVVVAGCVCNPASGEVFHARNDGPAYLGERVLHGPRPVPLARAVIGTGFAYDAAVRERQMRVAAPMLTRIADLRRLGSAALDLCFVAAGRLDAYFEAQLNLWDHAAGALVAARAGCVVGGLRGAAAGPQLVVAAGPQLAPDLFALLEGLDADEVGQVGQVGQVGRDGAVSS